uniref:Uncharacterized protein n=1 Tax=Arundo donax TaxID=35708 RepID=A0A0A9CQH6_ARUDO
MVVVSMMNLRIEVPSVITLIVPFTAFPSDASFCCRFCREAFPFWFSFDGGFLTGPFRSLSKQIST